MNKAFNVNPDIDPIGEIASKQIPIDPLGTAEDQVAELQAGGGRLVAPANDVFVPVMPGEISLAAGVLTIEGTGLNDVVEVRYVAGVGGAVSAVPTDWVRVTLDNPFGSQVRFFKTATIGSIEFDGLAGNDTFTNATGIGTTAYGGAGERHHQQRLRQRHHQRRCGKRTICPAVTDTTSSLGVPGTITCSAAMGTITSSAI